MVAAESRAAQPVFTVQSINRPAAAFEQQQPELCLCDGKPSLRRDLIVITGLRLVQSGAASERCPVRIRARLGERAAKRSSCLARMSKPAMRIIPADSRMPS